MILFSLCTLYKLVKLNEGEVDQDWEIKLRMAALRVRALTAS